MRKALTLAMLMLLTANAIDAQVRKTWNWKQGFSDETKANLDDDIAGPGNWTASKTNADGVNTEWKDAKKFYGTLKANNIPIKELYGIQIGSAGLSKNNNYLIRTNSFRVTRNKTEIILPKLAPGQTVTLRAQSANGTATNRGFKAGYDYMEYISGPDGGICIGNQAEGAKPEEDGFYTLKWKINDDGSGADSLDVKLVAVTGGLDICLIQIDEGDAVETTKVAYFYDSTNPNYKADKDTRDAIENHLQESGTSGVEIVNFDLSDKEAMSKVDRDSIATYDMVVLSAAINDDEPYAATLKEAIAYVPILNLSTNLYNTWGYGTATATTTGVLTVGNAARKSPLFKQNNSSTELVDENGELIFFDGANVTGYTNAENGYFAKDSVYAKAGDVNAIHIHRAQRNAYLLLPYSNNFGYAGESNLDLLPNAVDLVMGTKREVTAVPNSKVEEEYHNKYTTVSLKNSVNYANIYYTTDGSTPTKESTLYTEPFDINTEGVTVKTFATADGYLDGEVAEQTIKICELAKEPTATLTEEDGKTIVTLTPAVEGDSIMYNFTGSNSTAKSSGYEGPITLTKHATITFFTVGNEQYLQSESVTMDVKVKNEKVRMDVLAHFDANKDYSINGANPSYYIGKSAQNFYTDEVLETKEEIGEDGQPVVVNVYKPADNLTTINPGKGWEIKTYGQVVFWQSNTLTHNIGDIGGYNPQRAEDEDENATNYNIAFGGVGSNGDGVKDPTSGSLQSTEAFQGPFDIVTIWGEQGSKAELFVSTDSITWTSVGEIACPKYEADTKNRTWTRALTSYEGTDKVYVKLDSKSTNGRLFDLMLMYQGDKSNEYINSTSGIQEINKDAKAASELVRTYTYSINGTQTNGLSKGLNIVKEVYANGSVKTRKVIVR